MLENRSRLISIQLIFIFFLVLMTISLVPKMGLSAELSATGPLRAGSINPRYFADDRNQLVYLTGSHVWDNFQDWGKPSLDFDYTAYLNFLEKNNHNFIRLWKIGECSVKGDGFITPMPWERTGPGIANDGSPKFDLEKFNEAYFSRLRSRAIEAGKRGIYVSIMLFDGIYDWKTHPFNPDNNINRLGVNEADYFSLNIPEMNRIQKEYVRKVIDAVNGQDNILYEVGNEIKRHSLEWQYHIIDHIHTYERGKAKQHAVGMTSSGGNQADDLTNRDLMNSPADWISPRSSEPGQNYTYNPPPASGEKVIISDTDHLGGVLNDPTLDWVWKSFLRGCNPILMDVLQNKGAGSTDELLPNPDGLKQARKAMGQTLRFAKRIDLARMIPMGELSSSAYCLANPGSEYLIFQGDSQIGKRESVLQGLGILSRKIGIDLYGVSGSFQVEWFDPLSEMVIEEGSITGGGMRYFKVPFNGDAVLYLYRGARVEKENT